MVPDGHDRRAPDLGRAAGPSPFEQNPGCDARRGVERDPGYGEDKGAGATETCRESPALADESGESQRGQWKQEYLQVVHEHPRPEIEPKEIMRMRMVEL